MGACRRIADRPQLGAPWTRTLVWRHLQKVLTLCTTSSRPFDSHNVGERFETPGSETWRLGSTQRRAEPPHTKCGIQWGWESATHALPPAQLPYMLSHATIRHCMQPFELPLPTCVQSSLSQSCTPPPRSLAEDLAAKRSACFAANVCREHRVTARLLHHGKSQRRASFEPIVVNNTPQDSCSPSHLPCRCWQRLRPEGRRTSIDGRPGSNAEGFASQPPLYDAAERLREKSDSERGSMPGVARMPMTYDLKHRAQARGGCPSIFRTQPQPYKDSPATLPWLPPA